MISRLASEVSRLGSAIDDLQRRLKHTSIPDPPPRWVLMAARANMVRTDHWPDYYSVLCTYYGIPGLRAEVDGTIDAVANYSPFPVPTVRSKNKIMDKRTALHEFFHHLLHSIRGYYAGEAEQALADAFADACIANEALPVGDIPRRMKETNAT